MAIIEQGAPAGLNPGARNTAAGLSLLAAVAGAVIVGLIFFAPDTIAGWGVDRAADAMTVSLLAAGVVFVLLGAVITIARLGLGGAITLIGVLFWIAGCIAFKSFGWVLAAPVVLGLLGAMTGMVTNDRHAAETDPKLVYRQAGVTRLTHWVWAVTMFFMVVSGLQIFNARPNLYIGLQSGFGFENSILDVTAANTPTGAQGQTKLFGQTFDTTGWLGMSGDPANPDFVAFPAWSTIPSYRDLATGRVVHFFFAWVLVGTLALWLLNALLSGHLWRDIILRPRDIRGLPRDIVDHIRLRFEHGTTYSPLQKAAYFGIFVIAFPLIILTGLTMSPGMDAAWPWLLELFGGRQTARTIHFITMVAFVLFFVVHIIMVVLANPINELRSMITGYYKTNTEHESSGEAK